MDATPNPPASVHAGAPSIAAIVLLVLLNAALTFARSGTEVGGAYVYGFVIGSTVVTLLVVAVVDAIARRGGRRKDGRARVKVAIGTLAIVLLVNLFAFVGQAGARSSAAITAEERQGIAAGPDSIRHATLRFSLPSPGPSYKAFPPLQAKLDAAFSKQPDVAGWVYADPDRSESFIVQVTKFSKVTESGFRDFAKGMRNGVAQSSAATVVTDAVEWRNGRGDYRLVMKSPAGGYLKARCLSGSNGTTAEVVCVETIAKEENALEPVLTGLHVAP